MKAERRRYWKYLDSGEPVKVELMADGSEKIIRRAKMIPAGLYGRDEAFEIRMSDAE